MSTNPSRRYSRNARVSASGVDRTATRLGKVGDEIRDESTADPKTLPVREDVQFRHLKGIGKPTPDLLRADGPPHRFEPGLARERRKAKAKADERPIASHRDRGANPSCAVSRRALTARAEEASGG